MVLLYGETGTVLGPGLVFPPHEELRFVAMILVSSSSGGVISAESTPVRVQVLKLTFHLIMSM